MKAIFGFCVLFFLESSAVYTKPPKLIWMERFDVFDTDTWTHLVTAWDGGNNEFQLYRNDRRNSYVKDGYLHIRPTFTADEFGEGFLSKGVLKYPDCNMQPCSSHGSNQEIIHPILSARIMTKNSFTFKYGKIEIRAKMPKGDWLWPAIWMLPAEPSPYGGWPTNGEIDLVEIRANADLKNEKNEQYGIRRKLSTLHFGPDGNRNSWHLAHHEKLLDEGDFSESFHTFGMEWTNCSITFILDGMPVGKVQPPEGGFWELGGFGDPKDNVWKNGGRMAPFDQKFYLVMNVAVGGNFFPPNWRSNGKPRPWKQGSRSNKKEFWNARKDWQSTWVQPEMIVDHILVYGYDN